MTTVPVPTLDPKLSLAYIDGAFVEPRSKKTVPSYAPSTGQVLIEAAGCEAADVDEAVRSARAAFERGDWSQASPAERKRVLLKLADLVERDAAELAALDAIDAGKPIDDCEGGDLPETISTLRWYAEATDKLFDRVAPTGPDVLATITREPVGVVAAVLPWNFPLYIAVLKVAPALAAGNSIVVKPAEQAPLSTLRLAELATEAGLPVGCFNVVPGFGEQAGRALGEHLDVDALTFTGSTEVGRHFVRYSANSNLKKVVLECGGKSPQIVTDDASLDLDYVADQLAVAAFYNTGQNCTAGSRILVHESLRRPLVNALARATATWPVGDPMDRSTRIGPLIERSAVDRVAQYVDAARAAGAGVVSGGGRALAETGGWYFEPTILDNVKPDMPVAREEIFGPVVSVISYESESEAIRIANDTTYGLAAAVYSRDLEVAHRLARQIKAGTVSVNCYSEGDIGTPFGGYRQSGFGGRDMGLEAFDQYTELKTTWVNLNSPRI